MDDVLVDYEAEEYAKKSLPKWVVGAKYHDEDFGCDYEIISQTESDGSEVLEVSFSNLGNCDDFSSLLEINRKYTFKQDGLADLWWNDNIAWCFQLEFPDNEFTCCIIWIAGEPQPFFDLV